MMKIPFLDMKKDSERMIKAGLLDRVEEVIRSGHYLFGPNLQKLEEKLGLMFNAEVIVVGSGTDALYLSLRALGIGIGDRVAVPAISAIPTAVAVEMTGAEPIYVDVEPETGNMDCEDLEKTLNKNSISAIMPVHLYGNPAKVYDMLRICEERSLSIPIIEDCAQSFGSNNFRISGVCGALSFYPTKNLGCFGDGGAVVVTDTSLAEELRELRFYGQKNKYAMGQRAGMNSRMDEIQCSILLHKLENVEEELAQRKSLQYKYDRQISRVQTVNWDVFAVPHLYPVFPKFRKLFIAKMSERGIETAMHYPFTLLEAVGKMYHTHPNAKWLSESCVSIPFHTQLTTEEIDYITSSIEESI